MLTSKTHDRPEPVTGELPVVDLILLYLDFRPHEHFHEINQSSPFFNGFHCKLLRFLWITEGPFMRNTSSVTSKKGKLEDWANWEDPSQPRCFLEGEMWIATEEAYSGAMTWRSLRKRSTKPRKRVFPPAKTVFEKSYFLTLSRHFMMDSHTRNVTPSSFQKSLSGHDHAVTPSATDRPLGRLYIDESFFSSVDSSKYLLCSLPSART